MAKPKVIELRIGNSNDEIDIVHECETLNLLRNRLPSPGTWRVSYE